MVGHRQALGASAGVGVAVDFEQQFFNELKQVVDLLEFAPRVLVELAFAGEDVQLLQQRDRLPRAQGLRHGRAQGGFGGSRHACLHGPTPSAAHPCGPKARKVARLRS